MGMHPIMNLIIEFRNHNHFKGVFRYNFKINVMEYYIAKYVIRCLPEKGTLQAFIISNLLKKSLMPVTCILNLKFKTIYLRY